MQALDAGLLAAYATPRVLLVFATRRRLAGVSAWIAGALSSKR